MEISEIFGAQAASASNGSKPEELGREDFLRMLIAQLENQDPLNPQESTEFTAQLAQFSSLDQLVSMRQSIEQLAATADLSDGLSAASLIGQSALVESQAVFIGDPKAPPSVFLELPDSADILSVELLDEDRNPVAFASGLGSHEAGRHELDWSAFNRIPTEPGVYGLRVSVAAGDPSPTTLLHSLVTGAVLNGSGTALQLGGLEVPLSSLREIGAPPKREG